MNDELSFRDALHHTITFHGDSEEPMLSIAPDGFYVRGVKLEQDEHEARRVYDAFCEFLSGTGHLK